MFQAHAVGTETSKDTLAKMTLRRRGTQALGPLPSRARPTAFRRESPPKGSDGGRLSYQ